MKSAEVCRSFNPWSCDRGSKGEVVDPSLCMVCGMSEDAHSKPRAESKERCPDCGCRLAAWLGGLEEHAPGCSRFPL